MYPLRSIPRFPDQLPIRNGRLLHGVLEESVEQLPAVFCRSAIESECEFVEIVVQMLRADGPLMGSQQPAFQQRGDPVTRRQQTVSHIRLLANKFMPVTQAIQLAVSPPSIRSDHRARLRGFLHGGFQTWGRSIRDAPQPDSSNAIVIHLDQHHNQRLSGGPAATFSPFFPADIGFIHLDHAGQPVPPWTHHGAPQAMQPCPSGSITAQSQNPLDPQGARAIFLSCDPPNGAKPQRQRFVCPVKDGSCYHGNLIVASRALEQRRANRPRLLMAATGATKALRPTQPPKIIPTRFLRRESRFEFRERLGVFVHGQHILPVGVA